MMTKSIITRLTKKYESLDMEDDFYRTHMLGYCHGVLELACEAYVDDIFTLEDYKKIKAKCEEITTAIIDRNN